MTSNKTVPYEKFVEAAARVYGDKVSVKPIKAEQEQIDKINIQKGMVLTVEDVENYGLHAWVADQATCVECGNQLGGLFGYFTWGIRHGYGYCTECETQYQFYHYICDKNGDKFRLGAYALVSMPMDKMEQVRDILEVQDASNK